MSKYFLWKGTTASPGFRPLPSGKGDPLPTLHTPSVMSAGVDSRHVSVIDDLCLFTYLFAMTYFHVS